MYIVLYLIKQCFKWFKNDQSHHEFIGEVILKGKHCLSDIQYVYYNIISEIICCLHIACLNSRLLF